MVSGGRPTLGRELTRFGYEGSVAVMTSHSHYAAQQAAADSVELVPAARSARQSRTSGVVTVGAFSGRWKSKSAAQSVACLYNAEDESRCGFVAKRSDILTKPPRWATRCSRCASSTYCPDCGDTANAKHRKDCIYGGQR